ncbi:unnamed protein product [Pylaiella littoralis]
MSWYITLVVDSTPANNLTFGNKVFLSFEDFEAVRARCPPANVNLHSNGSNDTLVSVGDWVFTASPHDGIARGKIGLNALQRRTAKLALNAGIPVYPFSETAGDVTMAALNVTVDLMVKGKGRAKQVDALKLSEAFKVNFNHQVFTSGQILAMPFEGSKLSITVDNVELAALGGGGGGDGGAAGSHRGGITHGMLNKQTDISWAKQPGSLVNLEGGTGPGGQNIIFRTDFDFAKLGIGGLGKEFSQIFRRAFASRIYNSAVVREMGINHVRGMLLFGPPGCGKTLIARKIGQVLNARDPKIVNGPEVLDKFVGGSEEKIRALFADAEKEQARRLCAEQGEASMLHIVIFDEIDAICKTRGSVRDGTGVSDSVVNQLLSKIDGVDSLNNVLIIGMTNRKDMIDDALLRPGRLEVHVEIGLPDEAGRLQILNIHTSGMKEKGRLDKKTAENMEELAMLTKNFSGAEIEGLVKSAASYAFERGIDVKHLDKAPDPKALVVQWQDFQRALSEVQPKFGADNQELQTLYYNGIVSYGQEFEDVRTTLDRLVEQTRNSERTPIMSVLLQGEAFSGKTALMAHTAVESGFPFIRKIAADELIGMGEASKAGYISKVFLDSYKSPLSIILIDDLERVIDFVRTGPRFSNTVLQTLLVLLKKPPPQGNRLLVMATTAIPYLLEDLMLVQAFMVSLHVPQLQGGDSVKTVLKELVPMSQADIDSIARVITNPIGIKQLLMVTEMARTDEETVSCERFLECLYTSGYSAASASAPQG